MVVPTYSRPNFGPGDFSESQIKRILLQLSAEVMPLDTVGEDGRIYENVHETFAPWDNPDQLVQLADENMQHKTMRSLNDYSIYERLNYDSGQFSYSIRSGSYNLSSFGWASI